MLTFKLQKLTLLMILVLVAMAGTLTFTAGMVVGVHWTLSNPELEVMLANRAATQTPDSGQTAAVTTQRVSSQATVSPNTTAAWTQPAAVTPAKPVVTRPTITKPAATKPTVTRPAIAPAAITPTMITAPEPAEPPPSVPPVQVAADADSMGAGAEELAAMTDTPRFAIQVGAFLYEENSTRMVEELQGRGYEPYIVVKTNSADRVLETVRFGHYPSRQQATLAASEFMAREGSDTANVRELGTR